MYNVCCRGMMKWHYCSTCVYGGHMMRNWKLFVLLSTLVEQLHWNEWEPYCIPEGLGFYSNWRALKVKGQIDSAPLKQNKTCSSNLGQRWASCWSAKHHSSGMREEETHREPHMPELQNGEAKQNTASLHERRRGEERREKEEEERAARSCCCCCVFFCASSLQTWSLCVAFKIRLLS